jgi:hypothetical protein
MAMVPVKTFFLDKEKERKKKRDAYFFAQSYDKSNKVKYLALSLT